MEAEIPNYNEELAEAYYASMKERWDRYAIEETAKKEGKMEGKKEGLIEGKREGLIEGKREGLMEGEKQGILTVALYMKRANVPIDKIILFTGLGKSQIEELQ